MSSTSHSLTVLEENLRQAETEMHRHSILHHNQSQKYSIFHPIQSQKPSGGSPVGLSIILPILQGCEVIAAASPLPFLAPAFAATVKLIKSIQAADSNRSSRADLVKKTSSYLDALREYDSCSSYDSISKLVQKHTQDFVHSLEQLKERSNAFASHGTLYDILHSSANKAAIEKIDRELETAKNLHFLQLFEAMRKGMDTLHKEHNSQQDPPPYPYTDNGPQAYMRPKSSVNEESVPRHTKSAYNPHPGDYMCMPVPDLGGTGHNNYAFEFIQMPIPEPYYPPHISQHISQPRHY